MAGKPGNKRFRSAVTGRFTTLRNALRRPRTTVAESRRGRKR